MVEEQAVEQEVLVEIEEQQQIVGFDFGKYKREDKPLKELPPKRQGIASILNVQEPAVRLKSIANDSSMRTHFNNKMIFPPNIKDVVADN